MDGRLLTMGIRNGGEELIAVSIKNGKELWSAKIGEILKNGWGDGPRGTLTVDGDHVYALSGRAERRRSLTNNPVPAAARLLT